MFQNETCVEGFSQPRTAGLARERMGASASFSWRGAGENAALQSIGVGDSKRNESRLHSTATFAIVCREIHTLTHCRHVRLLARVLQTRTNTRAASVRPEERQAAGMRSNSSGDLRRRAEPVARDPSMKAGLSTPNSLRRHCLLTTTAAARSIESVARNTRAVPESVKRSRAREGRRRNAFPGTTGAA
jgi:hypothetical protein